MIGEPDISRAWCQGHFGTKAEADAMAADIEKQEGVCGRIAPQMRVEHDRAGGWNLWLWE